MTNAERVREITRSLLWLEQSYPDGIQDVAATMNQIAARDRMRRARAAKAAKLAAADAARAAQQLEPSVGPGGGQP